MNKIVKFFTKDSSLIPLMAILLGLLFGAVVMLLGGYNPLLAYTALFQKVFGDLYNIGETIRQITPLIFTGLSVAFAFRTGLFNIGAEGQFVMGSLGAVWIGTQFALPWYIHAPLAIIVGALLGGFWGAISGYLKAKRGVNEVITTIMLNYISLYLANYIIANYLRAPGQQRSEIIQDSASISLNTLSEFFGYARLHWGIILAILAAFVFYIILWKTKMGFELRAVGFNPHAAEYAGMNVNKNVINAMFIGGVFAGLGGAIEVLGVFKYMTISASLPGYGFDGIAVALIGANTALGVIFAAILFGVLEFGAAGMKFVAGVPIEVIEIVIASVIFFVAASGLVKFILKPFRRKEKGGAVE
ncbi:branched-chain amino acid ABC transporter permease [Vulcanibacillus modesticaldus]|uniref:Branched-chain amino acid ABC transporter permease n=1 Tax=Vulcanibacillus modesticaldus TaxID=337097 RepID=A0A1D2YXI3_9BACI|nr:ABC transporter permease [Vulcanibacillus modesticaldus]OEG00465.1 branched-chain amino acid ABC transporter permease [Vulcanibacillus modesticaldus]